jgi:hypothetical protein
MPRCSTRRLVASRSNRCPPGVSETSICRASFVVAQATD